VDKGACRIDHEWIGGEVTSVPRSAVGGVAAISRLSEALIPQRERPCPAPQASTGASLAWCGTEYPRMLMMIGRTLLLGASVLLAVGNAHATPVDDCNQSADAALQIEGCTRLLRLDPFGPNAALAYGLRGEAYKDKGELDRAIVDFNSAIAIDPESFNFYVNRGIAHREKGELDLALADFNKAIEINGQFAESFINRCVVYEDKGQYDLAIADCASAITLSPDEAVAYNDRGVAYDKKGDLDNALADYTAAIKIDPNSRDAYANRAVLYDHKGDRERAIADYRAALARNPKAEDARDIEDALKRLGAPP
jgi:tetratricopeptide (TPR) repeat protein